MATFLAGQEVVLHGHGQGTGRPRRISWPSLCVVCSVLLDLEVLGGEPNRECRPPLRATALRMSALDVEVEVVVAELVGLGVGRCARVRGRSGSARAVRSDHGPASRTDREGVRADLAQSLRGQLVAALAVLDQAGFFEQSGHLGSCARGTLGRLVLPGAHADPIEVDLGQGPRGWRLPASAARVGRGRPARSMTAAASAKPSGSWPLEVRSAGSNPGLREQPAWRLALNWSICQLRSRFREQLSGRGLRAEPLLEGNVELSIALHGEPCAEP